MTAMTVLKNQSLQFADATSISQDAVIPVLTTPIEAIAISVDSISTPIKGCAKALRSQLSLATTLVFSLFGSAAIASYTELPQQMYNVTETGLTHLVEQAPELALATLIFIKEQTSAAYIDYLADTPRLHHTPKPRQKVKLSVKVANTLATRVPQVDKKSSNLALDTINFFQEKALSPFASFAERMAPHKNEASKVATLQEINNFLNFKHDEYSYVENKFFIENAKTKLPRFEKMFKTAAQLNQLDWRLIASISYQESVWNPQAVSPTGVKGMMMLTNSTAEEVGITDRTNPAQSIAGGTAYFKKILNRIPAQVQGPDRVLMALASYNMGYGHLKAARALTTQQGGDSTKWSQVKKRIPLLQKEKYYRNSKYGYARNALQALHYVAEIQKHYDMLLMLTEKSRIKSGTLPKASKDAFQLARY